MRRLQGWINPLVAIGLLAGGVYYGLKESGVELAIGVKTSRLIVALTMESEDGTIDREMALEFGRSNESLSCSKWEVISDNREVATGYSCQVGWIK